MLKTVQVFAAISLACQAWLPVACGKDVSLADTINLNKRDEQADALVPKGSHRQKRDWEFLEEYFARPLNDHNLGSVWDSSRSLGTFWNVEGINNFPKQAAFGKEPDAKSDITNRCVLVFDYPGYWKELGNASEITNIYAFYDRPLAVAPLCGPVDAPDSYKEFPRASKEEDKDKVDSLVFRSYYSKDPDATDIYYVVREPKYVPGSQPDDWKLEELDNDAIFLAKDDATFMPGSLRDNKENTKKAIRNSLRKWTKDNNNGNVPNPYKHGPGSDAWWKWSQINFFWGYGENGSRKPHP